MPNADIYKDLKDKKVLGTQIPVYKSGDLEYEVSVDVANLLYRFSRPTCVVKPELPVHVEEVVKYAYENKTPITVKNGGHSYAGLSTTNDGILLDLSRMNDVYLQHKSEPPTITMQGGALWAHAYRQLVIEKVNKLVVNGGRCPTVGVSGFVLGGGLGPFTRKFGMGCDSLLEATLVTGKGDLVTVRKDDPDPEKRKLFWALCGAGANNFGAVITMKMSLHELQEEKVVAGRYTWYPSTDEREEGFMEAMNSFYAANWSNSMTIDTSWFCDLKDGKGDLAVRFLTYYDGKKQEFQEEIDRKLRGDAGSDIHKIKNSLADNIKRRSIAEDSSRFLHETLVSQWSEETKKAIPSNKAYSIYASFVFGTEPDYTGITKSIRDHMKNFKKEFRGESALLQVTFIHTGQQATRIGANETAFPWRDASRIAYIMLQWDEKWLGEEMEEFCKNFKENLMQFSIDRKAGFLNFPDRELCVKEDHHQAYYGPNSDAIREIKQTWDPKGIFQFAPKNERDESIATDIVPILQAALSIEEIVSASLPHLNPLMTLISQLSAGNLS
ncbi:hypothetical protein F9C07_11354 [Aspergillus flavus]|uniref:FAD-binding PCMH-type domain-containing protein n=1 Tax=Aspergillus flavus (strain ATCC 200026 / FGSC A1120 / IAM 13836 / NRRL 3357 / JCM 12722 / SRRC 167) TaxID=332952 RepID=A0A7U2MSX8_ASPFN|nr:uncharacterized protein G4B84_000078 [Aspergillus flavus NRRL3357]KAF7630650.1 hypothetical protein AFLA_011271 [Aspergillus flavus NRRL3357]QMW24833.1 hypothetical protein G4B84_000078 [Aspergillus flavus NRRL3357]QRD89268.1 hypothetical protein F9C07_11354 [Aspergillus flavus]